MFYLRKGKRMNRNLCLAGYTGAKNKSAKKYIDLLPYKSIHTYAELMGGCGNILINKPPHENEIYSEVSEELLSIFECLVDKDLSNRMYNEMLNMEYSQECFDTAKNHWENETDKVKKAVMCLTMLLQSQNGAFNKWKGDKHLSRERYKFERKLIDLKEAMNRLSGVQIYRQGAFKLLDELKNDKGVVCCADPPYRIEDRISKVLYKHDWTDEMHKEFLKLCIEAKCKMIVCSYENEMYNKILIDKGGWNIVQMVVQAKSMSFIRGKKATAVEVVYMNY